MAVSDFLKEGAEIPAGSAITSTTTQSTGPAWLNDYVRNLVARQNAVGGAEYSKYQGPRVAPVNTDMVNSYAMTRDAAGSYAPGLATAENTVAQGAATSGSAQAAPWINAAGGTIQNGINQQGGLSAAQPWLNAASDNTANVNSYMNPYTDSVVDRIGELGVRNLNEKIMPGLEGRYIKAGQFRGSGQMTDTARAIRDTSSDILAQQNAALNQGYTQAQTAKAADLARYGQLGQTAGGLAEQGRQNTIAGGTALGGLGSTMGNLGVQDASNLNTAGRTQADIAAERQKLGLTGAEAVNTQGVQQRGVEQENMSDMYAEFLRQQGWPQAQIDAQVKTLTGLKPVTPGQTSTEGIVPAGTAQEPGTLAKVGGIVTGLGGVVSAGHEAGWF